MGKTTNITLKRIVAITFVALISLAMAGPSIADKAKPKPPPSGGQNDPAQMFQQIMQQLTQGQARSNPTQDKKSKTPSGATLAPPPEGLLSSGGTGPAQSRVGTRNAVKGTIAPVSGSGTPVMQAK